MKSHKLIRKVLKKANIKKVSPDMKVSESMLYKWSEAGVSGRENPLERVAELYRCTGDRRLLEWFCAVGGGFFVLNSPFVKSGELLLMPVVLGLEKELAELQRLLAQVAADNQITKREAKQLRKRWERVKSVLEGFIKTCERGSFRGATTLLMLVWWWSTGDLPELVETVG